MSGTTVNIRMNQQQVELLDDACARLGGPDRAQVVRTALREHGPELLRQAAAAKGGAA